MSVLRFLKYCEEQQHSNHLILYWHYNYDFEVPIRKGPHPTIQKPRR